MRGRVNFARDMISYDFKKVCTKSPMEINIFMSFQVKFSDEKRFMVLNDGPVKVWRGRKNALLVARPENPSKKQERNHGLDGDKQ